jgi:SAM-dependent methyltransferase
MDTPEIIRRRAEVEARFGAWTSHNLELAPGVWTRPGRDDGGHPAALERLLRVVSDVTDKPFAALRVLDLGCLEGFYAVEFARRGAEVVGVEGREANVAKAALAREALALERLSFFQDDVRNLSAEVYGTFDVVLCLGIMYHLDAPDVFAFAARVAEVCTRLAVVETHVALRAETSRAYRGREYFGAPFTEHAAGSTAEDRLKAAWASLDNPESFWPTRASLYNLLADSGFTSVFRLHAPGQLPDRDTLVALKGQGPAPAERWPEETPERPGAARRLFRRLFRER